MFVIYPKRILAKGEYNKIKSYSLLINNRYLTKQLKCALLQPKATFTVQFFHMFLGTSRFSTTEFQSGRCRTTAEMLQIE